MRRVWGRFGAGALVVAFLVGIALAMVMPCVAIALLVTAILLAVLLLINQLCH